LDTRSKIVGQVPDGCDVVEGFFDPLLAAQATALAGRKGDRPLAVVVRDPDQPLLESRARAELVASLRAVDYVVIGGPVSGVRLAEDRDEFLQLVRAKHGS
jgi:hypothetical protein